MHNFQALTLHVVGLYHESDVAVLEGLGVISQLI